MISTLQRKLTRLSTTAKQKNARYRSSCELLREIWNFMEINASSWNLMQAYGTAFMLMELPASSLKCMQAHVSAFKLM